jgi:predicted NUDIX family NTP pyrophosphohydrolase
MPQPLSAGILVYPRTTNGSLEVLLAHPGGPFLFVARLEAALTG